MSSENSIVIEHLNKNYNVSKKTKTSYVLENINFIDVCIIKKNSTRN